MLPFTSAQFFQVFEAYNAATWPAPLIAYALGATAAGRLVRPGRRTDSLALGVLAAMWLWTGAAYHWAFFSEINRLAWLFGAAFMGQGAIFLWKALARERLAFRVESSTASLLGAGLIIYAALIYPAIGLLLGHRLLAQPLFGVAPCPVTIFTFGVLLLARSVPWPLLVIPVLWSLVGGTAAFLLGVPQDWVLLASGVGAVLILMFTGKISRSSPGSLSQHAHS